MCYRSNICFCPDVVLSGICPELEQIKKKHVVLFIISLCLKKIHQTCLASKLNIMGFDWEFQWTPTKIL